MTTTRPAIARSVREWLSLAASVAALAAALYAGAVAVNANRLVAAASRSLPRPARLLCLQDGYACVSEGGPGVWIPVAEFEARYSVICRKPID